MVNTLTKKNNFTLIELILSVGIVVVAITSFISFFPIGVKAGKDVVALSRVEALANPYISFIEDMFSNNMINDGDFYASESALPNGNIIYDPDPVALESSSTLSDSISDNLYEPTSAEPDYGAIQVKASNLDDPDNIIVFFGIEIRTYVTQTNIGADFVHNDNPDITITYSTVDTARTLTFEVSWPISEPRYNRRKKTRIQRTIFLEPMP